MKGLTCHSRLRVETDGKQGFSPRRCFPVHNPIGLKDPRTSLTLEDWLRLKTRLPRLGS